MKNRKLKKESREMLCQIGAESKFNNIIWDQRPAFKEGRRNTKSSEKEREREKNRGREKEKKLKKRELWRDPHALNYCIDPNIRVRKKKENTKSVISFQKIYFICFP